MDISFEQPKSGPPRSCPNSRNILEGHPGAHGRRTCSFHPGYFPNPGQVPTSLLRSPQRSRPGHLLTDRVLFVPPLAPPLARCLLIPTRALLVRLRPLPLSPPCRPASGLLQASVPGPAAPPDRPAGSAPAVTHPGSHRCGRAASPFPASAQPTSRPLGAWPQAGPTPLPFSQ